MSRWDSSHWWRFVALLAVAAIITSACSDGVANDVGPNGQRGSTATQATSRPGGTSSSAPVADSDANLAPVDAGMVEEGFDYSWRQVPLGAGGWVTGLVFHASGAMYVRTDVGGAYRYNAPDHIWEQMLTAPGVPGFEDAELDYAVEAIAVSPADPDVVAISVGGDENSAEGDPFEQTGRVLRSSDGGRSWQASAQRFFISGNQAHRQRSERLAYDPADPNRLLLGTRRQGLWESTNGGATFAQVPLSEIPPGVANRPDQDHAGVTFVTFDPDDPAAVFVGVGGEGVFASSDGGHTFDLLRGIGDGRQVPFEGTVTARKLLYSIVTIDGDEPGVLETYDLETQQFSRISPERGQSWAAAIDPTNPDHLVAADLAVTSGNIWRSTNGGGTWTALDVALDASTMPWMEATDIVDYMSIGRLVFDPVVAGRLWFAEGMGVWRTDDLMAPETPTTLTWTLDSRGIEETVVADVLAAPGADPIVAVADRQGFRSGSLDHYPVAPLVNNTFAGGTDLDYSGQNPNVLVWAGAEYHIYWEDRRVARGAISTDGGVTWTELDHLDQDMFAGNIAVSATDPDNIVWLPSYFINPFEYSDLGKGLFVTHDGGDDWENLTVDGKNNFHRFMWWLTRQALAADKVDGGVFYLQNDSEEFYVSTNGGSSWDKARYSAPCGEFNACHVFGQIFASPLNAAEVWSSVGEGGLFRSRDRGATPWQKIAPVNEVRAFGFGAPLTSGGPSTVFLYGRANDDPKLGFWRSTNDGVTWTLIGRAPRGLFATVTSVSGDFDIAGRVYVGYGGNGAIVGDDPAAG